MIEKTVLENKFVRLEPLDMQHVDELFKISVPETWEYMPVCVNDIEDFSKLIESADKNFGGGSSLAFTVIEKSTDKFAGSTSYLNYSAQHKRVEIGFTWYAPQWQRTVVNSACKLLLLTHAFEVLELNRVEFKTDSLNQRSRTAIARIGATEEGVFRNHMVLPAGRLRHSAYFSIIKEEWPNVKQRLMDRVYSQVR